jgi:hypothetical protein
MLFILAVPDLPYLWEQCGSAGGHSPGHRTLGTFRHHSFQEVVLEFSVVSSEISQHPVVSILVTLHVRLYQESSSMESRDQIANAIELCERIEPGRCY